MTKNFLKNRKLKQVSCFAILFLTAVISTVRAENTIVDITVTDGLVGLWKFDNAANLGAATIGTDLTWTGSPTSAAGITGGDGAASSPKGTYLTADNPIGANGGGTRTNEYTILIDLKLPTVDGWNPILETATPGAASTDNDYWISTSRGFGLNAQGYVGTVAGTVIADTWHRLVIYVDQGTLRSTYVDGAFIGNHYAGSVDGGQWSMGTIFSLFGDNTADERSDYVVTNVALWDRTLTTAEILELSGQMPPPVDFSTVPYLQNVKQDGMTIMWELSGPATCSVEYGLDTSYGQTTGTTSITSAGGTEAYQSVISGLTAGTTYHYRAIVDGTASNDRIFTTAPVGYANFSFGTWGDSQGDSSATSPMMIHMGQRVDIALGVGDLSGNGSGTDYGAAKTYFLDRVPANLGPASVPFYAIRGNHDSTSITPFIDLPATDGYGNYSFDYAGCHFTCIDDTSWPNIYNVADPEALLPQDVYDWVEADLAAAVANNARFIFLFIHRAPYYERWYRGQDDLQDNLVPMMEQYGVDVCFSGHMHGYQRGYLDNAGDGDGVYYCITGGGSWLDTALSDPQYEYEWAHMTVGGTTDTWSAYGITGGLVNEYVRIDIDEYGFTANMQGFYSNGTVWTGVTDVFGKDEPLADIVMDGRVDLEDFALLAGRWQDGSCAGDNCGGADANGDGVVNIGDLSIIANAWLWP